MGDFKKLTRADVRAIQQACTCPAGHRRPGEGCTTAVMRCNGAVAMWQKIQQTWRASRAKEPNRG